MSPDFLFTAQILVVLYICIHKLSFGLVLVPTWKRHKFANNAVTGISENVRKNNAVTSENVRKNNAVISENVRKNNAVISENVRKNNAVISEMKNNLEYTGTGTACC